MHGTWKKVIWIRHSPEKNILKNSSSWLQYYYDAWDLQKFQLVLDPHQIKNNTVSGYPTSMKHKTLKISFGNRIPANWFLIFFSSTTYWFMGIGKTVISPMKAFDKKKSQLNAKMRVPIMYRDRKHNVFSQYFVKSIEKNLRNIILLRNNKVFLNTLLPVMISSLLKPIYEPGAWFLKWFASFWVLGTEESR